MTSISCITGTGFMKCIPITCSGRLVRAAISVIEIELVLVARMVPAGAIRSSCSNRENLTAGFSLAASITRSARAAASSEVPVLSRASVWAGASAGIAPFFTWRSRLDLIVAWAFSSAAGTLSIRATSQPCCAKTWAMPLPMVPAPMTAARLMSNPFLPSDGRREPRRSGRAWRRVLPRVRTARR